MSPRPLHAVPDREPEPELADVLREAARTTIREADIARAAILACDAWGVPEGPLQFRLGVLAAWSRPYTHRREP